MISRADALKHFLNNLKILSTFTPFSLSAIYLPVLLQYIMKLRSLSITLALLLTAFVAENCTAARIVVLYPVGSKSHFYAVMPVIEELGERGHNVTVFTPFKGITKNATNVQEVIMTSVANELDAMDIDWFAMQKEGATQIFTMMQTMIALSTLGCEDLLSNPEFRRIVEKGDVDLFIVDAFGNEFTYPIIDKLGVPFVIHGSSSAFPSTLTAMGAPADYASVPLMLAEYDEQMTFAQRLANVFSGEFLKYFRNVVIFKKLDAIVQGEFPGVKPIVELEGEASLYITNTHPVTNWPRSLPPTILSIGALHARPAKQLPPVYLMKCTAEISSYITRNSKSNHFLSNIARH